MRYCWLFIWPAHHTSVLLIIGNPGPTILEDTENFTLLLKVINETQSDPDPDPERETELSLIALLKTVKAT